MTDHHPLSADRPPLSEARLAEIVKDWDGDEAGSHIEGNIDYLESNVIAGDITGTPADYFDADAGA